MAKLSLIMGKPEMATLAKQRKRAGTTTERESAPAGRCDSLNLWEVNHKRESEVIPR